MADPVTLKTPLTSLHARAEDAEDCLLRILGYAEGYEQIENPDVHQDALSRIARIARRGLGSDDGKSAEK